MCVWGDVWSVERKERMCTRTTGMCGRICVIGRVLGKEEGGGGRGGRGQSARTGAFMVIHYTHTPTSSRQTAKYVGACFACVTQGAEVLACAHYGQASSSGSINHTHTKPRDLPLKTTAVLVP